MGEHDECGSCGETPEGECPKSRRPCGHHCNHVWTHDHCDWCGAEFVDETPSALVEDPRHRDVVVSLTIDAGPFFAALARAAALAHAAASIAGLRARFHVRPDGSVRRVDAHHPKPLPIDGRAYHQRAALRLARTYLGETP